MLSEELVDKWFLCRDISRTELRNEAKEAIANRIIGDVLDKKYPGEFKFSEEIKLKRHTGLNCLSTHFPNGNKSEECVILYLKGNTIYVQDIKSNYIWELKVDTHLNFFSAIRILEYIEQGKYLL